MFIKRKWGGGNKLRRELITSAFINIQSDINILNELHKNQFNYSLRPCKWAVIAYFRNFIRWNSNLFTLYKTRFCRGCSVTTPSYGPAIRKSPIAYKWAVAVSSPKEKREAFATRRTNVP